MRLGSFENFVVACDATSVGAVVDNVEASRSTCKGEDVREDCETCIGAADLVPVTDDVGNRCEMEMSVRCVVSAIVLGSRSSTFAMPAAMPANSGFWWYFEMRSMTALSLSPVDLASNLLAGSASYPVVARLLTCGVYE